MVFQVHQFPAGEIFGFVEITRDMAAEFVFQIIASLIFYQPETLRLLLWVITPFMPEEVCLLWGPMSLQMLKMLISDWKAQEILQPTVFRLFSVAAEHLFPKILDFAARK